MTARPEEGHQAEVMQQVPWLAFDLKPGSPSLLVAHQPPTFYGTGGCPGPSRCQDLSEHCVYTLFPVACWVPLFSTSLLVTFCWGQVDLQGSSYIVVHLPLTPQVSVWLLLLWPLGESSFRDFSPR